MKLRTSPTAPTFLSAGTDSPRALWSSKGGPGTVSFWLLGFLLVCACRSLDEDLPDPQRFQVESARAVSLKVHRTVERSIPLHLESGQALVIRDHYGDIAVTVDDQGSPRCHATINFSASDQEGADALESTIGLASRVTEEGLQVFLNEPERDNELVFVASASLEIFVPPGTPLKVQLERGSLNATGPFGQTRASTNKGDLRLRRVDGGVIARSNSGDVKLRQCTGGPVRASTDKGMVALLGSRSDSARLETARGKIVVNSSSGGSLECIARLGSVRLISVRAEARIEAGTSVRVEDFEGRSLHIEKGVGRATLKQVRAERVELESEAGEVELVRITAPEMAIEAESGTLKLTDLHGSIRALTGVGDVDAALLKGPTSSLANEQGSMTVRDVRGQLKTSVGRGQTKVTHAAGDLDLASEQGSIKASGDLGNVVIDSAIGGIVLRTDADIPTSMSWRIASGQGDLVLFLPQGMGFGVEARASDGLIDSEFQIVVGAGVAQAPSTLRGKVGGGGPTLELFAERGNVALKKIKKRSP